MKEIVAFIGFSLALSGGANATPITCDPDKLNVFLQKFYSSEDFRKYHSEETIEFTEYYSVSGEIEKSEPTMEQIEEAPFFRFPEVSNKHYVHKFLGYEDGAGCKVSISSNIEKYRYDFWFAEMDDSYRLVKIHNHN